MLIEQTVSVKINSLNTAHYEKHYDLPKKMVYMETHVLKMLRKE